jgi:hypothetical protein
MIHQKRYICPCKKYYAFSVVHCWCWSCFVPSHRAAHVSEMHVAYIFRVEQSRENEFPCLKKFGSKRATDGSEEAGTVRWQCEQEWPLEWPQTRQKRAGVWHSWKCSVGKITLNFLCRGWRGLGGGGGIPLICVRLWQTGIGRKKSSEWCVLRGARRV